MKGTVGGGIVAGNGNIGSKKKQLTVNKEKEKELKTYAQNTWCPGCGNFAILNGVKKVFLEMELDLRKVVMVSGIGCHAKIVDYLNVNSFYSIHGRVPPTATGIKLGNPELTVIGFAGDGDAYGEGLAHLMFAAKRNIDITMVIHNNRVYGLTTGQFTPTSPIGFKGKSTPGGSLEGPLNPPVLMLDAGATFIARTYSNRLDNLKMCLKKAIEHRGFSFVEVLQPCYTYFNTYDYYNKMVYEIDVEAGIDVGADIGKAKNKQKRAELIEVARKKMLEWSYGLEGENGESRIPIGIFYTEEKPTYDELVLNGLNPSKRENKVNIKSFLEKMI